MTIFQGQSLKKLNLYPLSKPLLKVDEPFWIDLEEENTLCKDDVQHVLTIKRTLALKFLDENIMMSNYMKNLFIPKYSKLGNGLTNLMTMDLLMKMQ